MRKGFKAEAERTSLFYRQLLKLKERDPMPARDLANFLGIMIITPRDIPGMDDYTLNLLLVDGKDYWSGAIYLRDGELYIIYNPTHSPARQESDLMHEIAHALCNHTLGDIEQAIVGCMLPLRKYDKEQEEEAEWLGACLQLPQKALFYYYKVKKLGIPEICALFNASKQMVNYRMRMTAMNRIKWEP